MSEPHEGTANRPTTSGGTQESNGSPKHVPSEVVEPPQQHDKEQGHCSLALDVEQNDKVTLGKKKYNGLGVTTTHFQFWNSKIDGFMKHNLNEIDILTFLEGVPHMAAMISDMQAKIAEVDEAGLEEEAKIVKAETEAAEMEDEREAKEAEKKEELDRNAARYLKVFGHLLTLPEDDLKRLFVEKFFEDKAIRDEIQESEIQIRKCKRESEKLTQESEKQYRKHKRESAHMTVFLERMSVVFQKTLDIAMIAINIETPLLALLSLARAERTITSNTATTDSWDMLQKEAQRQADVIFEGESMRSSAGGFSALFGGLMERKQDFSHVFDRESLHLVKESNKLLAGVSNVFDIGFQKNNFAIENQSNVNGQSTATCKKIIQDSPKTLLSSFNSIIIGEAINSDVAIKYPGPTSQQVVVIQLIMHALLKGIGDVCRLVQSKSETAKQSPPKSGILQEKVVLANDKRNGRCCNFSIRKRGRYMVVLLDGFMELRFEIQRGQRAKESVMEMYHQARGQCLSHLSDSLLGCLRFAGGAGVPSHATGVFGSLTHIEIIQLVLKEPGTEGACLEYLSTGPLPLVKEELFLLWFNVDKTQQNKGVEEMRKLLYEGHTDRGLDKDGVPLGIKALHALMMCPWYELFGPRWDKISSDLGDLLGTGTFGMVFRSAHDEQLALKVSKSGLHHHIQREAAILKYLSSKKDRPASVLSFVASGLLNVTIGGVGLLLPALAVSPVGSTLYSTMAQHPEDIYKIVKIVMEDMGSALEFIHKEGICHNDVNDSNITLVPTGNDEKWRAILIDFSIASQQYKKIVGFRGTAPFVHRDVHQNKHWFPVADFDLTSLGFTLVVLLEHGVVPWLHLKPNEEEDSVVARRVALAVAVLADKEKGLPGELAAGIETLVRLDEKTFVFKGCDCDPKCLHANCSCRRNKRSCSVLCSCYDNKKDHEEESFHCHSSCSFMPLPPLDNLFTDPIFPTEQQN